jgi:membrane protease subunit HflC
VKLPFIQVANFFPKHLLEWDGQPGQIPTREKTFITVDAFARWRINDPLKFYMAVGHVGGAQRKLDDILDAATYNFITSNSLIDVVRSTNRKMKEEESIIEGEDAVRLKDKVEQLPVIALGRVGMTRGILEQAAPKLSDDFGIEIVDFKIKRVNYVEEVRKKVYERMIAERKQISQKLRSEGQGEARRIEGDQQRDLRQIQSEAYRKAQEIKGKADAQAAQIYADAFSRDPDFYTFVNTLEIYKQALDKETQVILSTDSDFFKYLKQYR